MFIQLFKQCRYLSKMLRKLEWAITLRASVGEVVASFLGKHLKKISFLSWQIDPVEGVKRPKADLQQKGELDDSCNYRGVRF